MLRVNCCLSNKHKILLIQLYSSLRQVIHYRLTFIVRKQTKTAISGYCSFYLMFIKRSLAYSQLSGVYFIYGIDKAFERQAGGTMSDFLMGDVIIFYWRIFFWPEHEICISEDEPHIQPTRLHSSPPLLKCTVRHHWHISSGDSVVGCVFHDPPRFCYKRALTLGDYLVYSYYQAPIQPPFSFKIPEGSFFNCVVWNTLLMEMFYAP